MIKLTISEILFLLTGTVMLLALFFLGTQAGFLLWIWAKIFYFLGFSAFLYSFIKETHKKA